MLDFNANTLSEVVDAAVTIARTWAPNIIDPQELRFRGQAKTRFPLLPGLYRPTIRNFHYDEVALFERFKMYAIP